jgi:hypothetical protein
MTTVLQIEFGIRRNPWTAADPIGPHSAAQAVDLVDTRRWIDVGILTNSGLSAAVARSLSCHAPEPGFNGFEKLAGLRRTIGNRRYCRLGGDLAR